MERVHKVLELLSLDKSYKVAEFGRRLAEAQKIRMLIRMWTVMATLSKFPLKTKTASVVGIQATLAENLSIFYLCPETLRRLRLRAVN